MSVKEIDITVSELVGDQADEYEVIRYEITYRLAQCWVSYVMLKYRWLKHKPSQKMMITLASVAVLEKSYVDVSFIVGMLVDKFVYYQPLYR